MEPLRERLMGRGGSNLKDGLVRLLGPEKCLFDLEDRATYAFDAGHDKGTVPAAVILARSPEDVAAVMAFSRERGIPVIPRGAGSGLTGGAVPVTREAIVLSLARMNRIIEIDGANLCAVVEPGVVVADLQAEAGKHGLFYPPDPASLEFCTIGGNIAENAGGMRAVKYGVTKNAVMGLSVVLPDGRMISLGSKCIKDVAGYNMTEMFVGSEGTLGIVTRAIVRLLALPETKETLAVSFDAIQKAGRAVPQILQSGVTPCTLEFIDKTCLDALRKSGLMTGCEGFVHERAQAMLLIEVDGRRHQVEADAEQITAICQDKGMLSLFRAASEEEREKLWQVRRSIHGALAVLSTEWMEDDIAVPRAAIPDMLAALEELALQENLVIACFGHYGDGNIHLNAAGKEGPLDPVQAADLKKKILIKTAEFGGRIAAEHGIGLAKKDLLGINLNPHTMELTRELKQMLDPDNLLNPGKFAG